MKVKMKIIQCLILILGFNPVIFSQESKVDAGTSTTYLNPPPSSSLKAEENTNFKKPDKDGIIWLNPHEEPLSLVGFEWVNQDSVYRRLPVHPKWEISSGVDGLANMTAGGQIRFSTNSRRILVRVELMNKSGMYHMPATGQSGFDLYMDEEGVQRYVRTTRFPHDTLSYQAELFSTDENRLRTFTLNFPLYNGVNSLQVGFDYNSEIKAPAPFSFPGKIVIYGTSITQGGCVSRPGMAYSNIISRKLDVQFVNFGFSGNGRGEPALAHLINQISDVSLIILDYEANASKTIVNTLEPFIDILRKEQPDTPILVMSKIRYASAIEGSEGYILLMSNRDFQEKLINEKKLKGDNNIHFLDGSTVLGNDYYECTVDGGHTTDLGSRRIADALINAIEDIFHKEVCQ
jgi:lysophospholipase L1-like esterase